MNRSDHDHARHRDIVLLFGAAVIVLAIVRPDVPHRMPSTPGISAPDGLPSAMPTAQAAASTDGAAATSPAPAAPTKPLHGIDVSHYQGSVDWAKVAAAGVVFAYAKATGGVTFVDPRFAANASAAPAAGLHFGAYHFFQPSDDPTAQAEHFLSVANPGTGSLPPVLDLEKTDGGSDDLAQKAVTWLEHVKEKTGCTPLVYASTAFYDSHLGAALSDYPLYLADYSQSPKLPTDAGQLVLWQHAQTATVSGINGHVDLDLYEAGSVPIEEFLCP